jgi:hypothetical protein
VRGTSQTATSAATGPVRHRAVWHRAARFIHSTAVRRSLQMWRRSDSALGGLCRTFGFLDLDELDQIELSRGVRCSLQMLADLG